uniref:Uncharacterized protein n=1 Tax=Timema poppense TaxID=170557 RepID=A0A7R9DBS7_TIMPO|nr:unnamed protein product [Timema poppensis]
MGSSECLRQPSECRYLDEHQMMFRASAHKSLGGAASQASSSVHHDHEVLLVSGAGNVINSDLCGASFLHQVSGQYRVWSGTMLFHSSAAGNRYSVPACGALQEVGGSCRPDGHRTYNMSLTYPDGATVNFTNIYYLFCACAPGLECDRVTSSCQEVDELLDDNYLSQ